MHDRILNIADYQQLRQTFRWECPEYFNFGFDVIDDWARTRPDGLALRWVGPDGSESRSLTFAELSERTTQLACGFAHLGLTPGERVLVLLPRVVEWWETMAGLLKAGLVSCPGTTLLSARDIAYRVQAAEATAIVTDADGAAKVEQVLDRLPNLRHRILVAAGKEEERGGWQSYRELLERGSREWGVGNREETGNGERGAGNEESEPSSSALRAPHSAFRVPRSAFHSRADDPAMIYFTSGTTGMPKMVLHTQASYGIGHQVTGRLWLNLNEDDLHWNISDTGWAKAAWSSLFGPWICGSALFVHHATGKFNPGDVIRYLNEQPITTMCAAPTIYRVLVQQDLSQLRPMALRQCVAAGEPLNPEVIATWERATGLTIRDGYGQTETVLLCANFPGVPVRAGSMGLPTPGFDLEVIDHEGNVLPPNAEGDIAIRVEPARPLGMFREYWHNPDATAEAFRNGWYVTGDCGRVDEDGYFWFVGRADDVITSSAYRIGPFEVESALIEHPAVVEAAVVGKPDAVRGEIVKAFVVLARGFSAGDELRLELQEHVKRVTAPYKYPREIEFVHDLPKTTSGKIRRVELRQRG